MAAVNYRCQHIYYLYCLLCVFFPYNQQNTLYIIFVLFYKVLCVAALMCNLLMQKGKSLLEEDMEGVGLNFGEKYWYITDANFE